jgi:cytochrome b561
MTAIVLHWLMATLIGVNLWLGLTLGGVRGLAMRVGAFQWHATIGLTLLALGFARIGLRLAEPPPPEAPGRAHWQKSASNLLHVAFYAFMIGMPLSGWLLASADPRIAIVHLYRLGSLPGFPLPHLPWASTLPLQRRRALASAADSIHRDLAYAVFLLIGVHVLGVLRRQLFDPNPAMPRMLPFLKRRPTRP